MLRKAVLLVLVSLPFLCSAQKLHTNHAQNYTSVKPTWIGNIPLYQFQKSHLHYPSAEKDKGREGRTIVVFIVTADGNVEDVKVERTSGSEGLDAEACRFVRLMPRWKPATINGKKVPYQFVLPVVFRLN